MDGFLLWPNHRAGGERKFRDKRVIGNPREKAVRVQCESCIFNQCIRVWAQLAGAQRKR